MSSTLCISFRFIQPFPQYHGRGDADEPEWPPSPMRAFQALLNAACLRIRGRSLPPEVRSALQVIEVLHPSIVAPRATRCLVGHRAYVPHNQGDLVMAAWERGNTDVSIASHRVEKDLRPHRIETIGDGLPTLHYLYELDTTGVDPDAFLRAIRPSVRSIHCLGWGIDPVVADARLIESPANPLEGERWVPSSHEGKRLRVHRKGSLDALTARYDRFLKRLDQGKWTPVPPLTAFDPLLYRRDTDPQSRPYAVFKLLNADDDTYRHPHRKLVHIAGMVRHLAIDAMKRHPPQSIKDPGPWIERYIAGHRDAVENVVAVPHSQLSYIPLPSIGHHHADPSIRRVMIVAPTGDDAILEHLCQYLDGLRLKPERESDLDGSVFLHRTHNDKVASLYTRSNSDPPGHNRWATVTPVILPCHDDRKPEKTRKLIERALVQAGVTQPCEIGWSPFSYFPKMPRAYNHGNGRREAGHIRPSYLQNLKAVHLTLRFNDSVAIPGPIAIGSGRHCGFGLMARIE